jgi:hypothetical protein
MYSDEKVQVWLFTYCEQPGQPCFSAISGVDSAPVIAYHYFIKKYKTKV